MNIIAVVRLFWPCPNGWAVQTDRPANRGRPKETKRQKALHSALLLLLAGRG